ncbi:hypothetical protein C8R43DRAFT_1003653 [Mycena crocata]|nr:hypothetical protein C8R43DRAFT_1003653 [Mycena crocata]
MDPPVPMDKEYTLNRLRTGYVPAQSEIETIQIDLSSLSNELARLDALIEDLSIQQERVKEEIVLRQAIISPVRRLPDDVVQGIFLACLPSHRNAVMSAQEAPLLLCRVCSMWRALALETPRLWASLHLHLRFILHDYRNDHGKLDALSQWLERSGACPLAVSICGTDSGEGGGPMYLDSWEIDGKTPVQDLLLEVLLKSTPRWWDIELIDLPEEYLQTLRGASMPLLQAINVTDYENFPKWAGIFSTPSLRRLSAHFWLNKEHIPFFHGLHQITHISLKVIDSGSSHIFLAILKNLVHLVSLRLPLCDDLLETEIIRLPFLESLSLTGYGFDLSLAAAHLERIIMPRLAHLCLQSGDRGSDVPLFASLGSSSPLVENLEITLPSFTQNSLRDTLRHFPSLVKLTVRDGLRWQLQPQPGGQTGDLADTAWLLALLTINENTVTDICPRLAHLETSFSQNIPDETLSRFLQTRADSKRPFRFKLDFDPNSFSRLGFDAKKFISSGLDVSITNPASFSSFPRANPWSGLPEDDSTNY